MITNYLTTDAVSCHDPPATTHSGSHSSGSRVDHDRFYPAKADNLSAINQPKKGTNHG